MGINASLKYGSPKKIPAVEKQNMDVSKITNKSPP